MIYGTSNIHTVRDSTDMIGIRTLILRMYWQAPATNPAQDELDGMKPGIPAVPGGMMLMGEQTMKERGRYLTMWTFQGVNGNGKNVTFKTRGNSYDYGFEPGFAQVPIQLHKDFPAMQTEYQGYPSNDGTTVVWPATLAKSSGGGNATGSGSALSLTTSAANDANPMYGIQAFFEMDGIYRYRYAETTIPGNLESGVGRIADSIPGGPPPLSDGRNWLKAPTAYQRKGYVFDITEYYWLSRRGGWPAPVYGGSVSAGSGDSSLTQQRVADGSSAGMSSASGSGMGYGK